MVLIYVAGGVAAFIVGALPFSWLLGKYGARVDLRNVGSGNPGATNLYRVAGPAWGIAGLALDVLKGLAPVVVTRALWPGYGALAVVVGAAAVMGHIWTPFLGWRGGKGVATAAGVFLGLNPLVVAVAVAVFVIVVAISRYVSLGSIVAVAVAAASSLVLPAVFKKPVDVPFAIFCGAAAAAIIFAHRKNIVRMIRGEESRWGFRRDDGGG